MSFKKPRLLLGTAVLLSLVLSACGTTPPTTTSTLTVTVDGDGAGTVTSVPAGIDVTSGDAADTLEVTDGTEVTLTAVAATGSTFTGWTGACSGTSDCVLEVNGDATVAATFEVTPSNTLTVATDGTGAGNVTSVPAGIDLDASDASATFTAGTEVTLTATPAAGSAFGGWDGPCMGQGATCTFTFADSATITATFTSTADALIVATAGSGAGNVTSVPAGIDLDGGDASATFPFGTEVTLTATPATGSTFEGWDGACVGQGATCTFTFSEGTTITATFGLQNILLEVSVATGGAAGGSVTSDPAGIDTATADSGEFPFDTVVTLTATATSGAFAGWVGAGCDDVNVPVCEVTMDAAKDVIAGFNDVQTQTVRVAAGGDDAVEFLGDSVAGATWNPADPPSPRWFEGWVWAERTTLHLGWAVYHNLAEAAFRFPTVAVPSGAIVTSATLQVTSAGEEGGLPATGDLSLTIEGELSADPGGFVQPAPDEVSFAITSRPRTAASATWDITGVWATGTSYEAPNAASILQEIVDQPAWSSGNAVILFLQGGSLAEENYRRVHTFESGAPVERHPTLLVEYTVMPPLF